MQQTPVKVAVLMGGIGPEREVSLKSGSCVAQALNKTGYDAALYDVSPDHLDCLDDATVDVFFPALHGEFGEDGQLQAVLEQRGLTYTGSGPEACRVTFDKMVTKAVLEKLNLLTPTAIAFTSSMTSNRFAPLLDSLGERVVIKPICQGSSVGVQIVDVDDDVYDRCRSTLETFGTCMVETFISGHEVTVGILDQTALPVLEIRTATGFYDYHAKYEDERTTYSFDESDAAEHIQQAALTCFHGMGLRHMARVDFILTEFGRAYVLEINAIPGLTSHSLLPSAAARMGLDMSELCSRIVEAALGRQAVAMTSDRNVINGDGKNT